MGALCKATFKWGLLISIPICSDPQKWTLESVAAIRKMVPWLSTSDFEMVLVEGGAIVLCDTKAERDELFSKTHGDDGPCIPTTTRSNPPCLLREYHVHAVTCDPTGLVDNENS